MNHGIAYESSYICLSNIIKSNHEIMNLIKNVELIKAYFYNNHIQESKFHSEFCATVLNNAIIKRISSRCTLASPFQVTDRTTRRAHTSALFNLPWLHNNKRIFRFTGI